jgi:hypothetical protein
VTKGQNLTQKTKRILTVEDNCFVTQQLLRSIFWFQVVSLKAYEQLIRWQSAKNCNVEKNENEQNNVCTRIEPRVQNKKNKIEIQNQFLSMTSIVLNPQFGVF